MGLPVRFNENWLTTSTVILIVVNVVAAVYVGLAPGDHGELETFLIGTAGALVSRFLKKNYPSDPTPSTQSGADRP